MRLKWVGLSMIGLLLTGCAVLNPPQPNDPAFAPVPPERMRPPATKNGAIYQDGYGLNLFETNRAVHVGDILTVQLVERTNAQKQSINNQRKQNQQTLENPTLLGRAIELGAGYNLGFTVDNDGQFNALANTQQNNKLEGYIAVTVTEVLPNGNLRIRGEKWLTLNTGKEFIRLTGLVRPFDINEDNIVRSDRVADARIDYSGTGQVHNTNVMGWLSKFLWSGLWLL